MEGIADSNRKAYDSVAEEYSQRRPILDNNNRKVIGIFIDFLDKRYANRDRNDMSILDVGIGSGLDLGIFNEQGYKTFGNDISEKMIEVA